MRVGGVMERAFMTGSSVLASLEGQQYVVLRPRGDVATFYDAERAAFRSALPAAVTSPNTGHVTLRGFEEPARTAELKDFLARWAGRQEPIEVEVTDVDGFAPPFQILIARLARSSSLVGAYASLTAALDGTDFRRVGELPLEDWVFHLSLIYASALTEDEWDRAHANAICSVGGRPSELLTEAELVWYAGGVEYTEIFPFGSNELASRR